MAPRLVLGRVQSLLGVLPLGGYLGYHLYDQWPATRGREAWVEHTVRSPVAGWILGALAALAAAHAVLGILRLTTEREQPPLRVRYVQALTGAITLGFVLYHVVQVWSSGSGSHTSVRAPYDTLFRLAGQPLHLLIYLVGITAAWFHFAHGLSRVVGSRLGAQPDGAISVRARIVSGALGFVLWLLSLQLLAHYALGGPLFAF